MKRLTTTQEVLVKSLTGKATPVKKSKPTLKRRVGRGVDYTYAKLANMQIDKDKELSKEREKDNSKGF